MNMIKTKQQIVRPGNPTGPSQRVGRAARRKVGPPRTTATKPIVDDIESPLPTRALKPYASSAKKKAVKSPNLAPVIEYVATEKQEADRSIQYALQFFHQQGLDDSGYVEGEYFIDVMHLPRTDEEAFRMAKHFEEDASRWA